MPPSKGKEFKSACRKDEGRTVYVKNGKDFVKRKVIVDSKNAHKPETKFVMRAVSKKHKQKGGEPGDGDDTLQLAMQELNYEIGLLSGFVILFTDTDPNLLASIRKAISLLQPHRFQLMDGKNIERMNKNVELDGGTIHILYYHGYWFLIKEYL